MQSLVLPAIRRIFPVQTRITGGIREKMNLTGLRCKAQSLVFAILYQALEIYLKILRFFSANLRKNVFCLASKRKIETFINLFSTNK